jgi:DNA polymerase V
VTNAQTLGCGYPYADALLIVKEMCDASCLDLVAQRCTADSVTLAVRYEMGRWGAIDGDGGTARFPAPTNSRDVIMPLIVALFEDVADRERAVHGLMLNFNGVAPEDKAQLTLFDDADSLAEERSRQEAILDVKRKFGKNALLKGIDLMPQATQRDRNRLLGGHKSGE